ncbi:MAG: hypothetical protein FWF05_04730 [Oscillospiraceae bacterium]|nr:hypothetical protein [Oscillospiraceae bacterium]
MVYSVPVDEVREVIELETAILLVLKKETVNADENKTEYAVAKPDGSILLPFDEHLFSYEDKYGHVGGGVFYTKDGYYDALKNSFLPGWTAPEPPSEFERFSSEGLVFRNEEPDKPPKEGGMTLFKKLVSKEPEEERPEYAEKQGFYDKKGSLIIDLTKYDLLNSPKFVSGHAVLHFLGKDSKYYFAVIDKSGAETFRNGGKEEETAEESYYYQFSNGTVFFDKKCRTVSGEVLYEWTKLGKKDTKMIELPNGIVKVEVFKSSFYSAKRNGVLFMDINDGKEITLQR